jgi:3-oxoacyl-[acyl-carrier-protein] synthase-3
MARLRGFGCYLPARAVGNDELGAKLGVDPEWILNATGIEERRFAAPDESIVTLAARAAQDCLDSAQVSSGEIDLLLVASGSAERRFPGPATAVGSALGIGGTPAIDLPMASAGSLFGLALAAGLCHRYRSILVVGAEIMSRVVATESTSKDVAILFGDGAGACLVSADHGAWRIADWLLASDGEFASALELDYALALRMDGRTIILQAGRKLPDIVRQLAVRNNLGLDQIGTLILHQANRNLILRVAQSLGIDDSRTIQNVQRYGNTSSASLLIATCDWWRTGGGSSRNPVIFAAFGAGLNWGALLAVREDRPAELE